jgi:uncharacterized membrane protein
MTSVKNTIYFFVFVFILIGVYGITTWVALDQLTPPLSYAVIAFLWGITLAILYLAFDKAGWDWWGT